MPKVSIIVPIYKAEKYIHRCIDSILAQTFTDWELLLVDDGSPDRSGEICDEYAKKDKRIRVFHKENGGVSSARNWGLENVRGEYVTFVDADDKLDADALNVCMTEIETNDLDILQFSFTRNEHLLGSLGDDCTEVCSLPDYLGKRRLLVCVWGTVIRTSIIHANKIRFDGHMKLAEDQLFLFSCMEHATKLMRIPNRLYYYYDNPQSATNNEQTDDIVYTSNRCIGFKKEHPLFAFRLDDLVLFFIEKLILRKCYSEANALLKKLEPTYFNLRPWPTVLMVNVERHSHKLGFCLGVIMYTAYAKILGTCYSLKKVIKRMSICRK